MTVRVNLIARANLSDETGWIAHLTLILPPTHPAVAEHPLFYVVPKDRYSPEYVLSMETIGGLKTWTGQLRKVKVGISYGDRHLQLTLLRPKRRTRPYSAVSRTTLSNGCSAHALLPSPRLKKNHPTLTTTLPSHSRSFFSLALLLTPWTRALQRSRRSQSRYPSSATLVVSPVSLSLRSTMTLGVSCTPPHSF